MADTVTFAAAPTGAMPPPPTGEPPTAPAPTAPTPPVVPPPTAPPVPTAPPSPLITDDDVNAAQDEFTRDGKLSDKTIESFEKRGIPRKFVETYIKGGQAISAQLTASIHQEVGGKDNFEKIKAWTATGLTPEARAAYEQAIKTGDIHTITLAVRGLHSKYVESMGSPPTLVSGSNGTGGPAPFESLAQMTAAMADPKYRTDPAYRKLVESRAMATKEFVK